MVDNVFDFGQYLNKLSPVEEIDRISKISFTDKDKIKITLKEEFEEEISEEIPIKERIIPDKTKKSIESTISSKTSKENKIKAPYDSILTKRKSVEYFKKESDYIPDLRPVKGIFLSSKIIVIGASVGGPRTISTILREIPNGVRAPILIVQHLSAHFSEAFVENLNLECDLDIIIAKNGEFLKTGKFYIAPGEKHMEIVEKSNKPYLNIYKGTPLNFCMPSINVLFFSAAKIY